MEIFTAENTAISGPGVSKASDAFVITAYLQFMCPCFLIKFKYKVKT